MGCRLHLLHWRVPTFKFVLLASVILHVTSGQDVTTAMPELEETTGSTTSDPEIVTDPAVDAVDAPIVDPVDTSGVDPGIDPTVDPVEATEPTPTKADLEAVQEELDQSCCFILDIDCDLVLSVMEPVKRRRRSEMGQRHRRQTNLSDRFIDQLGINLLRFETCLCQAVTSPSTCRMLYPPDFYRPSTAQVFSTAFQEKGVVKRMTCSFYSGSVVDCTFESSAPYHQNVTSEVVMLMKLARAVSLEDCAACDPLSCTFSVFKRRLQPQNSTFNQDYDACIHEATGTSVPGPTASPPAPILTPDTSGQPGGDDQFLSRAELYQHLATAIFPIVPTPQQVFPRLSDYGIFLGVGRLGGNTTMRELFGLTVDGRSAIYPRLDHGHGVRGHTHGGEGRDDHSNLTVMVGAVVGGLVAGALITFLLLLLFVYKNRPTSTRPRSKTSRSLRDMPNVKLDNDNFTPMPACGADMQPPVARVPPMMTVYPRRPSDTSGPAYPGLSRENLIHLTSPTGLSPSNPYLLEMETCPDHYNISYEDTEQLSTSIYSSVDDDLVETDAEHAAVSATTSTAALSPGKTGDSSPRHTPAAKSPRASRVPEVPVFVKPRPRGADKPRREVQISMGINKGGRPQQKCSALERPVVKPPVLPKPNTSESWSTPEPREAQDKRPLSTPVLTRVSRSRTKPLSASNSLEPPAWTQPDTKSCSLEPPKWTNPDIGSCSLEPSKWTNPDIGSCSLEPSKWTKPELGSYSPSSDFSNDPSGIYEVPVVPKNMRSRVGPPSVPPPPVPSTPPAVPSLSRTGQSCVPPMPKVRGAIKIPPVPPRRNNAPRSSRISEVSKISSIGESDWSGCAEWDAAELESDFSDIENEYMEIRPDPADVTNHLAR